MKIVKVKFHDPALMAENAEEKVKQLFAQIDIDEETIANLHEEINELQKELKELYKKRSMVLSICDVICESEPKAPSGGSGYDLEGLGRILGFHFSSDVNKDIH